MSLRVILEFWSSDGDIALFINGKRYVYYTHDGAVVRHAAQLLHAGKPRQALAYLEQKAVTTITPNSNHKSKEVNNAI